MAVFRKKVRMGIGAGPEKGLNVVINQNPADYAYTLHSLIAAKVLVFEPANFPDRHSGAVLERLVPPHRIMELAVTPIPTDADKEMMKFGVNKRKCVFNGEQQMPSGM